MSETGKLYGVGVGPGDPELLTLKAARLIGSADVVAYFSALNRPSLARGIAAEQIRPGQVEMPLRYPVTTEIAASSLDYEDRLMGFYDGAAEELAGPLSQGKSVAVLCEGDPFLYGSFMYLFERLSGRFPTELVPGISSIMACSAAIATPLTFRDDVLTILPGTLDAATLSARLATADAAAIMKLGRNFAKVRDVLTAMGLADRARYVERATTTRERVLLLSDVDPAEVPYMAMVVVPSAGRRRVAVSVA